LNTEALCSKYFIDFVSGYDRFLNDYALAYYTIHDGMNDEIVLRSKGVEINSICKAGLFEQQARGSVGFRCSRPWIIS